MPADRSFVHLHVHTNFSFGDGACRIDELVEAAARAGMPALAVTDHDGLYGAVRFYQACQKAGIKPIVGVELNVESALPERRGGTLTPPAAEPQSAPLRIDRPHQGYDGVLRGQTAAPGWHLVLLAKDYQGWSNLCRIISAAHLEHPGEPPYARWETIERHAGHLIALSGCRRGELGAAVLAALRSKGKGGDAAGHRRLARRVAERYARTFGRGNYFIELQHELLPDSPQYVRELVALAHEQRLPVVATNNVHYLRREDAPLHDVLAAEAANQPLPNPLGRKNAELYFKSAAQMRSLFAALPEATRNTVRIADRCNLDLGLGQLLFPAYPLPPGETAYSLLCKKCFAGAAERYRPVTPEVTARLEHELKVIQQLSFAEYFLAVADIVDFSRAHQIPYSGRGSAGNSIVSYVLHICDSDPIAHDLLFERFLNPFRREMPDIDIDFCSERREEVIDYIYQRFGHQNVAMVATVNTAHAPSAVRIVAKAFGFRPDEVDRLSRKVPWGGAEKLSEMLVDRPELADHEFQHPHYRRLVHLAEKLADFPMLLGTHLGGFILSRDPLTDRIPLQWAAKGVVVAQFDKDDIETLGLVKMDILGLRMHSAIAEAVRRIKDRTGLQIDPWELPKEDPKVYELIGSARTLGMFQLESSGQRNLATRLKEREFEDVIAAISLFRPGPLQADMIAPFIRRRHGHERVTVAHRKMEPAVRGTYGVIIYQEQVISVAAAVAGFSLAEADMLRRAMTHDRSMEEMDQIGRTFVEKAVANGVEEATAEEVFRQLRGFAAYGFNKAHAACFAIICNATAWLKAHYPAEFYCGLMNNQPMGFYSPRVVLNDARRFGLAVLPVDINRSEEGFSVEVIDDAGRSSTTPAASSPASAAAGGTPPRGAQSSWPLSGAQTTGARALSGPGDAPTHRSTVVRQPFTMPEVPTYSERPDSTPPGSSAEHPVSPGGAEPAPADSPPTQLKSSPPLTPSTPASSGSPAPPTPADPLRDASGRRLGLRVGLKYVKEMSGEAMFAIVSQRGGVPRDILGRPVGDAALESESKSHSQPKLECQYTSLADFVARAQVSIEIAENLIRVGAFDALGTRREELLAQLPILYAGLHGRSRRGGGRRERGEQGRERSGLRERRGVDAGRASERTGAGGAARAAARTGGAARAAARAGDGTAAARAGLVPASQGEPLQLIPDQSEMPALDFLPSWTPEERVRAELAILGLNVSAHPLSFLRPELRALKVTRFDRLPRVRHGSRVRLAGVLERAQMPWIRSGHRTLFLTLEDETELAQVVVFNDIYQQFGRVLKNAIYLLVEGELQNDEEHGLAVVAKRVYDLLEVVRNGGAMPLAPRPVKRSADDRKGTPPAVQSGGGCGGRRDPDDGRGGGHDGDSARGDGSRSTQTLLGSGDSVYPWTGPAPEDTRLGPPARRLTLPEIEPRTRPGRTG